MNKPKNNIMRYVGWGTEMMCMLALLTWLGWFLDKKTGWKFPIFIIILPLVSLIYSLWKLIKALDNSEK